MTFDAARRWLIVFSLAASGVILVFCFAAPAFGYPLIWSEALRLAQSILPIFTGYLGTAAGFAFSSRIAEDKDGEQRLRPTTELLIRWPPIVCWLAIFVLLAAFGWSNRTAAIEGNGMSVQQLALGMALTLSIVTSTTGAAIIFLFPAAKKD